MTLTLEPALQTIGNIAALDQNQVRVRRARAPLHILVVEDDPVAQALARKLFEGRYCVTICSDVYEAVNEYLRIMPDLVLLDIELGDAQFNGLDVLHTLHAHDSEANVVMVSGHTDPENIAMAARAGANGFVLKPFVSSRLMHYALECERAKG